mgnify:CR=1 FL=1
MAQLIIDKNTQTKKQIKKQWKKSEIERLLKSNGYYLIRQGKGTHEIWGNDCGNKISIPLSCHYLIINRLIKENNLQEQVD